MISIFSMKKEIQRAEASTKPVMTRVRRMLRVSRKARKLAVAFAGMGINHVARGEKAAALRFANASQQMSRFADEVRERARRALGQTKRRLGFSYDAPMNAYPRWAPPQVAKLTETIPQ